jgi:hypothetical protein
VAPSNLSPFIEAVEQVTRTLTIALAHSDLMFAHGFADVNALRGLRHALEDAYSKLVALRAEVLAGNLGPADVHRETSLRERTAAVVMQIAELRISESEVAIYGHDMFSGRFRCLLDVTLYVLSRITHVNECRLHARLDSDAAQWNTNPVVIAAHREAYQFALDDAEHEFCEIGRDPDLIRFLEAGAWVPSEPFRIACRVIAMLFDVPLTHKRVAHASSIPRA